MSPKRAIGILLTGLLILSGSVASAKKKKAAAPEAGEAQPEGEAPVGDQPSKVLERAFKLYDGEDYYSASIELSKVVEGESGDSEPNKQKAEFWMGKALYNMKYYSASLSLLRSHRSEGPVARLLQRDPEVARVAVAPAARLDRHPREDRQVQPRRARSAGAREGARRALLPARQVLLPEGELQGGRRAVPGGPAEQRLLRRGQAVRGRDARSPVRGQAGRRVLQGGPADRGAERGSASIQPYADIANLSLARTFYSTGQFDLAAKYFDRVSPDSYDWANSLFESSWANFMLKDKGYSKALGNIHTIQAPYFETTSSPSRSPRALTVKATIYFYNCQYDRAEEAIGDFNAIYPDVFQELKKLINEDAGQRRSLRGGGQDPQADLGAAGAGRARRARRSRRLDAWSRFDYVRELDSELKRYDKADAAWKSTNIAQNVFADLTLQRSLAVNEAGDLARRRIKRLTEELSQLIKRVIKIEYEILAGQKGELEEEVKQEQQVIHDRHGRTPRRRDPRRRRARDLAVQRRVLARRARVLPGQDRNKCGGQAPEGAPSTGESATPAAPAGGDTGGGGHRRRRRRSGGRRRAPRSSAPTAPCCRHSLVQRRSQRSVVAVANSGEINE